MDFVKFLYFTFPNLTSSANMWAFVLGILPALAWLYFFLQEDSLRPEPKRFIFYIFFIGGLMTIPAITAQFVFQDSFKEFLLKQMPLAFFSFAFFEEIFKFLGVYLAARWNKEFNEPLDAMIYMITAALGFATVENIGVLSGLTELPWIDFLRDSLNAISLRFIGATLLHALAAGLIGYYWAWGIIKKKEKKYIGVGLIIAIIIHTIFNFLISLFQNTNLIYPSIFLIFVAFFVLNDFEKLKEYEENNIS